MGIELNFRREKKGFAKFLKLDFCFFASDYLWTFLSCNKTDLRAKIFRKFNFFFHAS